MTSLRTPFAGVFAVAMLLFGTSAASQAASVETSCVGYARAVTDHLRPNAPKGSPEYRAVYFPTLEECRRRGGSAAMPGGLAAAPWYLPRPAAPRANPYTPPPPAASSSGGSSSGLPTPPAPPSANPYNPPPASSSGLPRPPAPPANPYNPAANPNPPAPPPGSPNPPATAGKTPAEIVAYGKQKVAQSLPGGMSFPAAVRAAIDGCGALALAQANAAGANGSAAWQKAASDAVSRCISQGGAINGQFTLSRDLDLALRMAKHKSAPFERAAGVPGNHACAPLKNDADYKSCLTEAGQWFICYRTACHLAQPGLFPAAGASPSVSLFYNCPGAQCRTGASGPLASGQKLNDAARALVDRCYPPALAAANQAGPVRSPVWYQAGRSSLQQCVAAAQPPIVGVAVNKRLGATKGRECATGADGQTYCVDDNGAVCVQQPSGQCTRYEVEDTIDVTGRDPNRPIDPVSEGAEDLYNNPGGQNRPTIDNTRNPVGDPPIIAREHTNEERFRSCKNRYGEDEIKAWKCFMEKCRVAMTPTFGEALGEQVCRNAWRTLDLQDRMPRWREVTKPFDHAPEPPSSYWDTFPGRWLIFIGETGIVGLGVAAVILAGPGILVAGAATMGAAVLIGVVTGSAGGGITGKSYEAIADQACRPHMQQLIARAKPPADLTAAGIKSVEDLLTELCALNLPDIAQIRAMQRGTYQGCEQQARYAQPVNGAPPIVAISRQLNNCLRSQSVQAAEKALLAPQAGQRFADQWSELLRSCAAGSGLRWHGDLENGAAWPVGAPAGGGEALLPLSACMLSAIK